MIKKLSMVLLAFALMSCTAANVLLGGATPAGVQVAGDKVVLEGTRALVLAHLTYESVGATALAGRRTGLVNDANWAKAKAYDNTIYAYLQKGDAAHTTAEKAAAAASALQAINELKALIPASLFSK